MRVKIKVVRQSRSEEEVRRAITQSFVDSVNQNKDDLSAVPPNEEELNRQIEKMIQETMRGEGQAQFHMRRYRANNTLHRIDTVNQNEDTWGKDGGFDETRIWGKRNPDGTMDRITIRYPQKTCTLDSTHEKSIWADPRYRQMGTLEQSVHTLIRASTGRVINNLQANPKAGPTLEQAPEKTASFINGDQTIRPRLGYSQLQGQRVIQIDFHVPEGAVDLFTVYCDPAHVNRPIKIIVRDKSGRTIRTTEQANFGQNGFPSYWKETTYTPNETEEYEKRFVTHIDLTNTPPPETFEFMVPEGFLGAKIDKDKVVFQYPDGRIEEKPRSLASDVPGKGAKRREGMPFSVLVNLWILISIGIICSMFSIYKRFNSTAEK